MAYEALAFCLIGLLLLMFGGMMDFISSTPKQREKAHKLVVWGLFSTMGAAICGLCHLLTV